MKRKPSKTAAVTRSAVPVFKQAQDLCCGDLFCFRGETYLCLSSFTDKRHTQTIVTAVSAVQNSDLFHKNLITVVRFLRVFSVEVCQHLEMQLQVLDNSKEETAQVDPTQLAKLSRSLPCE